MEEERLLSKKVNSEQDHSLERSLRPDSFSQYIGQKRIKDELKVYIKAAKQREEALDHILLYGPPGLGKTTLAMVIGNEMGVNVKIASGPTIEKSGDLMALLNELQPGDILFIDEIHRLPKPVSEMLYSAMEDFYVDIVVGQGPTAHPVHLSLPPFTLIGATTRAGLLTDPLRDRFGIIERMDYYQAPDLERIVKRSVSVLKTSITDEGAYEIAHRSRGTPRIANRLLKRIRDFAQVSKKTKIDLVIVNKALKSLGVDEIGLDQIDNKLLKTMIDYYNGGPVGLNTLAANIGEEQETIAKVYEPYLMQIGFINRTNRGRVVTKLGFKHLHRTPPKS